MALSETASALRRASEWLTYPSESDAPWTVFTWAEMTGEPDAERVRLKGRHRPTAPATEASVEEFFTPLTADQDWHREEEKAVAAKYEVLLGVVRERLVNPKVVRIGGRRVIVYVIGEASEGGWAGLKTAAVET